MLQLSKLVFVHLLALVGRDTGHIPAIIIILR